MTTPFASVQLWQQANLATFAPDHPGIGIIEDGAVAVRAGRILYAGPAQALPAELRAAEQVYDCGGRWITPGLVDCHTHLVYAGNRTNEFALRLAGASYTEIAQAGGGIVSSVRALRAADEATLLAQSLVRLDALLAAGVTTVEIKSGYGLDLPNERKSLRVARQLAAVRPVQVQTSFLGAHALPPEAHDTSSYLDLLVTTVLPTLADEQLIDAVDGFCESIAFSPAEMRQLFQAAQARGFPVKLHADQLSNLHGAALAAEFGALSADHLEYTDAGGAAAMAQAGTVAVLLPGAYYFLREKQRPPVAEFRRHGVPLAVATDLNPGTSPLTSPLLAMNLAATLFGLTVEECLAGVTREAARALGLLDEIGTLEAGKWADLAIWDITQPAELVYWIGLNPLYQRVWRGTHG